MNFNEVMKAAQTQREVIDLKADLRADMRREELAKMADDAENYANLHSNKRNYRRYVRPGVSLAPNTAEDFEGYISLNEASKIIGIAEHTLSKYCASGRLNAVKMRKPKKVQCGTLKKIMQETALTIEKKEKLNGG